MDLIKTGEFIKKLRVNKNLTQKELAEKLMVTHQAVSKWENGETLPDASILLELSSLLNTNVDMLLRGGVYLFSGRSVLHISDVLDVFNKIKTIKNTFGEKSTFYLGMVEGINNKMNFDFEDALNNHLEVLVAEVLLQSITSDNKYVLEEEVNNYFSNEKLKTIVLNETKKIKCIL